MGTTVKAVHHILAVGVILAGLLVLYRVLRYASAPEPTTLAAVFEGALLVLALSAILWALEYIENHLSRRLGA